MDSNVASEQVNMSSRCSSRNGNQVTRIIVHHMAGVMTAKNCAIMHRDDTDPVSATYYIGYSGDCVQGVDESMRPWTSGGWAADKNAITIEVSNSKANSSWPISNASFATLVRLCADICARNNLGQLTFTGNKTTDTLSCHKQWDATECPGPTLYAKLPELCTKVNKILAEEGYDGEEADDTTEAVVESNATDKAGNVDIAAVIAGKKESAALYRVRRTASDSKTQIGAFKDKAKAIAFADSKTTSTVTYNVYCDGKLIHTGILKDNIYRVRKSINDAKTQIGAFKMKTLAVAMAKKNKGYSVYQNGKTIYKSK